MKYRGNGMKGFWNYRFLQKPVYKDDKIVGYYYELIEVYYNSEHEMVAWSGEAETMTTDSQKDLKSYIKLIKDAAKKSVLEVVDGSIIDTKKKMIESVEIYE